MNTFFRFFIGINLLMLMGCQDDLWTSQSEPSNRSISAMSESDSVCEIDELSIPEIRDLVNLKGETASFASKEDWYSFRKYVYRLNSEERTQLKNELVDEAGFPLLQVAYENFYNGIEQDSSDSFFESQLENNADIFTTIALPNGDEELEHLYESHDPTFLVVDRNSVFEVDGEYGKLIGGTVIWRTSYTDAAAIAPSTNLHSDGSGTTLYTEIDTSEVLDPRSTCDMEEQSRIMERNRRWCRNDRRIRFKWNVLNVFIDEIPRADGGKDKLYHLYSFFQSRSFKKYACIWGRYQTIHYRKEADFDLKIRVKNSGGTITDEINGSAYSRPQRHDRSARTWETSQLVYAYIKSTDKIEYCWTKERIDVSSRPFGTSQWLIVDQ